MTDWLPEILGTVGHMQERTRTLEAIREEQSRLEYRLSLLMAGRKKRALKRCSRDGRGSQISFLCMFQSPMS